MLVVLLVIYHCSHTMVGKGANSWKNRSKKAKAKAKSLLKKKKENQQCLGCLNKSCPKKFNNDEDKCGES